MPDRLLGHGCVKKKVLQLVPSFNQGGSERQALQLARLLQDDGTHDIRLACLNKGGILLDSDIGRRFVEIPEFPLNSFYDLNFFRQVRTFSGWLRANDIEVVQTHDFYTNIFGMIGSRIAGVRVRIAAKRETGMRTALQNFIERRAFRLASAVVVNSEAVRRSLLDSGVSKRKLQLVYNGIDMAQFDGYSRDRAAVLRELGLPAESKFRFVTIVANLREKVKNHEMFLRAAKRVAEEFPDARFVAAGEGERMRLITEEAERLGIADRMFFIGRCTRIPELLGASAICVLTSDSEGFANSILEYMAAGKPVVATNVGGAAEAIVEGVTGFLVDANDDRAMAERIVTLLGQPALAERFGNVARERVAERFSIRRQLERTLELFEPGNGGGNYA